MRYRLIESEWLAKQNSRPKNPIIIEYDDTQITQERLQKANELGYNIYYFPNGNSSPLPEKIKYLYAKYVDTFSYVFVDCDLKDGVYKSFEEFGDVLDKFPLRPTKTVVSGHGIHAYWKINNLSRETYCAIQKRLIKHFNTDDSVWTVLQLMRLEGYKNVKNENEKDLWCYVVDDENLTSEKGYTVEELFKHTPELEDKDKRAIQDHLDKCDGKKKNLIRKVDVKNLPERFVVLLGKNEKLNMWFYRPDDRSRCDMKIANLLQQGGFSEDEAFIVLSNTDKGQERGTEYVEALIRKVYDNPLEQTDRDYTDITEILSQDETIELIAKDNRAFKILQEKEKIEVHKKVMKEQGKFSIKSDRKKMATEYVNYTQTMIQYSGKNLPLFGEKFSDMIHFIPIDICFIGGESGRGKSTTVASIAVNNLNLKKKILVLSTEESKEQHIDRIVGTLLGKDFSQYKKWTDFERMQVTRAYIEKYSEQLVVLDYLYETSDGVKSNLTSVEGLKNVLEGVKDDGFDLIIIDYWTKISDSLLKPNQEGFKNLDEAAKVIEEYNKAYKIPLVVFGQLMEGSEDKMFKDRIEGRKSIYNYFTVCIETITDFDARITTFIPRKLRFGSENLGKRFDFRYSQGKYVEI